MTTQAKTPEANAGTEAIENSPADATRTLVIEREFPHPPEKVWRALTESPLLAQWLMNSDFKPVVGQKFQFRSEPVPNWNGIIDCEVLIIDPLKRLSYTWASLGYEGDYELILKDLLRRG